MFRNYLKTAIRSLLNNRLVSFINIFGLGLSMSVGMMVMIIVQDNMSYDKFHHHPERTYRITSAYEQKEGRKWQLASTPAPLYDWLKTDTADIEEVASLYPAFYGKTGSGVKELSLSGAFTEPAFFKVFGFSLAEGNPETCLQLPNQLVLSPAAALRFFGRTDPMGKTLHLEKAGDFVVTGLLKAAPGKSHIDFEAYVSAASIPAMAKQHLLEDKTNDWSDFKAAYTYVVLKKGVRPDAMQGRINSLAEQFNREDKKGRTFFSRQLIEEIRPSNDNIYNDIGGGTSWGKLWASIGIALIILLAACFNYTNLTIARALTRAKEVGIRKIVGARRYQLFLQHIMEASLLAFLALGFSWVLLSAIVYYAPFNDGYEMVPSSFRYNSNFVLYTIGFALFTGLVAGSAPAWILSSFTPLRVLKNLVTAKIFGKIGLQKTLIVFQYSLSLVSIIFLFTFFRQFSLLGSVDPGFRKDNILVIKLNEVNEKIAVQVLSQVSGVSSVSALSTSFNSHFEGERGHGRIINDPNNEVPINFFYADPAFIPGMDLELVAGRNFQVAKDSLHAEREIIINVKAAQNLGFKIIGNALGRKLWVNDSLQLEIVGIVKDFHYENAGKPVDPAAFRQKNEQLAYLFVGVNTVDRQSVSSRIASVWKTLGSSQPYSASWLNEDLDRNNSQKATISLLGYLAFMAVSIATLGLLGLVIYTVETRRKEIGIRKVMGAEKKQVVAILSGKFIKLIFIAGAIAVPIGYVLSYLFLQNFAVRVGYGLVGALGCFLFLLGIGLVTIMSQTYKAAAENPVKGLRTE